MKLYIFLDRTFVIFVENQTVAGFSINKQGRSYICGKSVDGSLRCVIIDSILVEGGDLTSGYFGGYFKEVADQYRATGQFVSKLWKTVCETGIFFREKEIWEPLSTQARGCGNDILTEKGKTFQTLQINERRSRYVLYFGWRDNCGSDAKCRQREKIPAFKDSPF